MSLADDIAKDLKSYLDNIIVEKVYNNLKYTYYDGYAEIDLEKEVRSIEMVELYSEEEWKEFER